MNRRRVIVLTAVAGVLAGVLVFIAAISVAGSGKAKSKLGSDRFVVGRTRPLAQLVDRHGPLLFQDLVGGDRDVFVQHLAGFRAAAGWRVFEAHAPDAPRRCQLRWDKAAAAFRDRCSDAFYPADGTGLVSYPTSVDEKGRLSVDLRTPLETTTTSTTTTSVLEKGP